MGRALPLLLAAALTAAAGLALLRPAEEPPPPYRQEQRSAEETAAASAPPLPADDEVAALAAEAPAPAPEIVPRASRDVTPSGVTPGPPVTGPLVRIPPPPRPVAEPPPPRPRLERLFRPVVESAGTLTTAAGRLRLADIEAPEPEATCGEAAASWPCGLVARAELRRLVRGRAVECEVPAGADSLPDSVRCSVAGSDIGEWLVRQGWARPAGETYAEAAREAEAERRGLWGASPRRAGEPSLSGRR